MTSPKSLPLLDRLLPVLILVCMVGGVLLGVYVPSVHTALDTVRIANVSLPIAIGLFLMMYPILCKVKYESLLELFRTRDMLKQLGLSFAINWLVAPLLMVALAWATLPDLPEHRTGIILVGIARCIAMVLIWNQLAGGDAEYCAILVAFNSLLQIILYSPLAYFYIVVVGQGSTINIDMWLVTKSVLIFLGIPLVLGWLTRLVLRRWKGDEWYERWFIRIVGPVSLMGLLFTILVMFALQGNRIVDNIGSVLRLIVPLVLYFGITFGGTLFVCYRLGLSYKLSVTQSFTASSNNFELAIAVAIATYGIDSFEALATVIGPLIEVPVLLGFVYVMRWAAHYWESPPEPLPLEEGVVELHAKE